GARISAGKLGSVDRSLPRAAVSDVNRSPVSCIPSPESPANRITTRSNRCRGLLLIRGGSPDLVSRSRCFHGRPLSALRASWSRPTERITTTTVGYSAFGATVHTPPPQPPRPHGRTRPPHDAARGDAVAGWHHAHLLRLSGQHLPVARRGGDPPPARPAGVCRGAARRPRDRLRRDGRLPRRQAAPRTEP